MDKNIFKHDAKTIVDSFFDARIFKMDITRDDMDAFEKFISTILQRRFNSYIEFNSLINNIESKGIFFAATNGDESAIKAIEYTGTILGKALADYVALLSPEAIFLTGGLAKAHSLLIPATEKAMNENMLKIFKNTVKIYPSELLEQNAGLLGAAAMIS